jgi:hypothetical protein
MERKKVLEQMLYKRCKSSPHSIENILPFGRKHIPKRGKERGKMEGRLHKRDKDIFL